MFQPLLKNDIRNIIKIQLDGLKKSVLESGIQLEFSDYALDYLSEKLNIHQVNTLGYCIGGTLLASTLGYMKAINDNMV